MRLGLSHGIKMNSSDKYADFRHPVEGLSIRFDWLRRYEPIFDNQIKKIRRDIAREKYNGKKIVYLSCPISSHAGGYFRTNVDINDFTAQRIKRKWGMDVWVLNPSSYQMQSYRGAERLSISALLASRETTNNEAEILSDMLEGFREDFMPTGSDYMRMWTKVLAEQVSSPEQKNGSLQPYGTSIDIYYFMGKSDVDDFFAYQSGGNSLASNVELYFSKELQSNAHYAEHFKDNPPLKSEFLDFYTHKASAIYSRGCHDEWNIWVELNWLRLNEVELLGREFHEHDARYGIGSQIPGYWEQKMINPASGEQAISPGYAAPEEEDE